MAFNNGFPVNYQQYYQPQVTTQVQQPQNNSNGIIWVQGETGAKSYLVAPNTTVQLWDSESQTIYLKSADVSGMPTMKVLDYTIRDNQTSNNTVQTDLTEQHNEYATKDEIASIKEQIDSLREQLEKLDKKKESF